MKAYKVEYNSKTRKFVFDEKPRTVNERILEDLPADGTDFYLSDLDSAKELTTELNKRPGNIKRCIQCGSYFILTVKDRQFYIKNRLLEPLRCSVCRVSNRERAMENIRKEVGGRRYETRKKI